MTHVDNYERTSERAHERHERAIRSLHRVVAEALRAAALLGARGMRCIVEREERVNGYRAGVYRDTLSAIFADMHEVGDAPWALPILAGIGGALLALDRAQSDSPTALDRKSASLEEVATVWRAKIPPARGRCFGHGHGGRVVVQPRSAKLLLAGAMVGGVEVTLRRTKRSDSWQGPSGLTVPAEAFKQALEEHLHDVAEAKKAKKP